MGTKKRKADDSAPAAAGSAASANTVMAADAAKKKKKPAKPVLHHDSDDEDDKGTKGQTNIPDDLDLTSLPPKHILEKLVSQIELQLPKDDHVKYDSRVKKLNWEKIAWEEMGAEDCVKNWAIIQERIRRFRTLGDLLPDARRWIMEPWTHFYKSKDQNRHPDMPKKPLSMYMLYYSEQREEIQKTNPKLSMPEVAKICSERYQKLSEKKKAKYKARCDQMRRDYEAKLEAFYQAVPHMRPPKSEKKAAKSAAAAALAAANEAALLQQQQAQQQQQAIQQQQQQAQQQAQQQQQQAAAAAALQIQPQIIQYTPGAQTVTISYDPSMVQQQPVTILPHMIQQATATGTQPTPQPVSIQSQQMQPQPVVTVSQPQPIQQQQQAQQAPIHSQLQNIAPGPSTVSTTSVTETKPTPSSLSAYPGAPDRPSKPYDLFFKAAMDEGMNQPGFDRQAVADRCRNEWKNMKNKKKAKWIKKAMDQYRRYEQEVEVFSKDNPGYIPAEKKAFLTQEDQKILDKAMGRPEKPPSSAYSLFSKEMLNDPIIKQYPSKERMAQISERWKTISQDQKDRYQAEVNSSMNDYRQRYENWLQDLSEEERKAETARMNTSKAKPKKEAKVVKTPGAALASLQPIPPQSQAQQQQQQQQQPPAIVTLSQQAQQQQQQQQQQQYQYQQIPFVITPQQGQAQQIINTQTMPVVTQPQQLPTQPQPQLLQANQPGQQMIMTSAQSGASVVSAPGPAVQPQQQTSQMVGQSQAAVTAAASAPQQQRDINALKADILKREPEEPARSHKLLFITEWLQKHKKKKPADAKEAWKKLGKPERKKWREKLDPQRQKYIDDYTIFVRGLNKQELELYTALKNKRDKEEEFRRQNEPSESEDSETSESESEETESESESD